MRKTAASSGLDGMGRHSAFTLLEMLIVLGIIGALAAISLPAIKGITKSNVMAAANRQLLDDIAQARQQAISQRTTVHIVFIPEIQNVNFGGASDRDQKLGNRLRSGAFTSYALFVERTVGDQPGRPHSRYLSAWKTLPDGIFFRQTEFTDFTKNPKLWFTLAPLNRPFKFTSLPFPTSTGPVLSLPHIAFDPQGSLVSFDPNGNRVFQEEVIELARGSILIQRDEQTGNLLFFDLKEKPPNNSITNYNRIRIDGLTGRARVDRPDIQ